MKRSILLFLALIISAYASEKLTPEGTRPPKVSFTRAENGPAYPGAGIRIVSPAANEVMDSDSISVMVDLIGFNLGVATPGDSAIELAYSKMDPAMPNMPYGQHVHVIIDNEPYMACYKPRTPFWIPKRLAPGMHTLRVFPSRSWHESVKQKDCFASELFYIKDKKGIPIDLSVPFLTYSRPKGEYSGQGARQVMTDFYVTNCELGEGKYSTKITVDDTTSTLTNKWSPVLIHNLASGKHTVKVTLIDPTGKPVEGIWNNTQRVITIK